MRLSWPELFLFVDAWLILLGQNIKGASGGRDHGKLVKHFLAVYQITVETPLSSPTTYYNLIFRNR